MKKIASAFFLSLAWSLGFAQEHLLPHIDSLKQQLGMAKDDTSRILIIAEICHDYSYSNYDSAIFYGQKALKLLERNNFPRGKARVCFGLGNAYETHGDIAKALGVLFDGLQLAEKNHCEIEKAGCLLYMGYCYYRLGDYSKAIDFYQRARHINRKVRQTDGLAFLAPETEVNLGAAFGKNNQFDSATICLRPFADAAPSSHWRAVALAWLGEVHIRTGNYQLAKECLTESFGLFVRNKDDFSVMFASLQLSDLYKNMSRPDSCLFYAQKGFAIARKLEASEYVLKSSLMLAEQFEKTDPKEAIRYHKIYEAANEEVYGPDKMVALQKTLLEEQERQRKAEADRLAYQNQMKQYAFLAGLTMLLLIAFILYRNNQKIKKARNLLRRQKEEIQSALSKLKSTQSQLIQSEKLASLGELTAGIAHEIQNPLNFVNNFAEVSAEILDEMHQELEKGDTTEAIAIATDLKTNLEKINHHGQRASSIVKGMLEHSRASTGVKEPTDLNALADEFLRLAYHGLRAKDNSFNATVETHFDESLPLVSVIPQDIGRVLLNLINNAFYAVAERSRSTVHQRAVETLHATSLQHSAYQPTITVSTQKIDDQILIKVQDNGNGIPEAIRDKIFQPFFTTKPTGQGTGLGLSLAYEIVTKGHGGTLEVETREGEGTEFVIQLPVKNNG